MTDVSFTRSLTDGAVAIVNRCGSSIAILLKIGDEEKDVLAEAVIRIAAERIRDDEDVRMEKKKTTKINQLPGGRS